MTVSPKNPRPGAALRAKAEAPPTPISRRSSGSSNDEVWRAATASLKAYGSPESLARPAALDPLTPPTSAGRPTESIEREPKIAESSKAQATTPLPAVPDCEIESQLQDIEALRLPVWAKASQDLRPDSRDFVHRKATYLYTVAQKRKEQWASETARAKERHLATLGSAFLAPSRTARSRSPDRSRDRGRTRSPDRHRSFEQHYRGRERLSISPSRDAPPSPAQPDFEDDRTVLLDVPSGVTQITPRMLRQLVARTSERRNAEFLLERRRSRYELRNWLEHVNDAITRGDLTLLDKEIDAADAEVRR